MIHMSSSPITEVVRVDAEVVSAPKPMTVPTVRNRTYSTKTLFEGNGRTLLWDGLGEDVSGANSAYEVCKLAGLDYRVNTEAIYTADGEKIPNMVCTRRIDTVGDTDVPSTVFGVVTNRYNPVQNYQGFDFIDTLFNHNGFQVETAGQFDDGKIVWVEAKLPTREMAGEKIDPYLVFTNRHDGKGSVKIFLTPVRVICKNTLNYAIKKAHGRSFSVTHTSSANLKLEQAKRTMENYYEYLDAMTNTIERQKQIRIEDRHLDQMMNTLFPIKEEATDREKERIMVNRSEVLNIYKNASDLDGYEQSGFRFVNAVSDWATHHTPARQTAKYRSNLMQKTLNGNEYIDRAVEMVDSMEPLVQIAV